MRNNQTRRWYRLRAGSYTMTTWMGQDQLTYLAARGPTGWAVSRRVAGAAMTITVGSELPTLRAAKALAEADQYDGPL